MNLSFLTVLKCCLLAGLVAGVFASVVALTVVEPAIAPALEIEEARSAAPADDHAGEEEAGHSHDEEEAVVSRPVQVAGGVVVAIGGSLVVGSLFAVAFGLLRRRLAGRTDFGKAVVLAAIGWAAVSLLPAVKIPANPPAVGDPETVQTRSAIWAATVVCGIVVAVVAHLVERRVAATGAGMPARAAATAATAVVLVVAVLLLVPWSPDSISSDVPAAVVWDFRLASLAELTVLWGVLGLTAGWLLTRASQAAQVTSRDEVTTPA